MKKEIKKILLFVLIIISIHVIFNMGSKLYYQHIQNNVKNKQKSYTEKVMRFHEILKAGDYKFINDNNMTYENLKNLDSTFHNTLTNLHLNKDTNIKYAKYIISNNAIYTNIEINNERGWLLYSPSSVQDKINYLRDLLKDDFYSSDYIEIFPFNHNRYVLAINKIIDLQDKRVVFNCTDEICEVNIFSDTLNSREDLSSTEYTYSKDGVLLNTNSSKPNYFAITLYILTLLLIITIFNSIKNLLLFKVKNNSIKKLVINTYLTIKFIGVILCILLVILTVILSF